MGHLEKTLQIKLAEAEDKYKYTIQLLTEENIHLRCAFLMQQPRVRGGVDCGAGEEKGCGAG